VWGVSRGTTGCSASSSAGSAFGSDSMLIENYVSHDNRFGHHALSTH
jgi:hypothetical protein